MLPIHIYHADWGSAANKRWLARATLGADDRYIAHAPALIEDHVDLIPSIRMQIDDGGCALVGFDLAKQYPQYAERLRALKARAWDMCAVIKDCVYHPEFRGSFSIKQVLPALVPDMSYEGLAIGNGMDVLPVWDRLLNDKCMTAAERQQLRADLLAYCGQDTLAMTRVLEVLVGLAGG